MKEKPTLALILAAGKGSRMHSTLPKPLVQVAGKPMVTYLTAALQKAGIKDISLIVGHKAEQVREALGSDFDYVFQEQQLGTAHAVKMALNAGETEDKDILVFVGDSPLLSSSTIRELIQKHRETEACCTFLSATFEQPYPYARVICDQNGKLIKCVEERDANPDELKVKEYLSSHFIFKAKALKEFIPQIQPHPKTGEYYLTDILHLLLRAGKPVEIAFTNDYQELVGLNTPQDVIWAESFIKKR